jgi:hypothetical protein
MSQTETHFGKLKRVEINIPLEEWFKEKCKEKGIEEIPSYYENWGETFRDNFPNRFFIHDEEVWEAIDHIESDGEDIDVMIPNEDGTITFVMQFYNGGTCLPEMIEEGLARLKTK